VKTASPSEYVILICVFFVIKVQLLFLLNLDTLEDRRLKFDLIYCYKIIFGLVRVNRDELFELATSRTRGHPSKLYKRFCSSSARSLFFSERLINCWNQLPNWLILVLCINLKIH